MRTEWFADIDEEKPELFQACMQIEGGGICVPLGGIWFHSREDAEAFIKENITNAYHVLV